ncbi:MAG: nucleotide-binding protein [Bacteroidetes bacterium]|nr:nucleotide-binding protein [Bacteroidota bacterium]
MKRKLFIGSSTEGLSVARKLKEVIDSSCSTWIDVEVWNEGNIFAMNSNTLDSLVWASRRYDYGLLVASNDDLVESRKSVKSAPRDNVLLELGMFWEVWV